MPGMIKIFWFGFEHWSHDKCSVQMLIYLRFTNVVLRGDFIGVLPYDPSQRLAGINIEFEFFDLGVHDCLCFGFHGCTV